MFGFWGSSRNTPPPAHTSSRQNMVPVHYGYDARPVPSPGQRSSRNYGSSPQVLSAPRYPQTKLPPALPAPPKEPEEVVIAVMGATGSGKSTFINLISGSNLSVGQGLRSCTSKVETAKTFEMFGKLVTLVDTPGFDDTTVSDTDILKMIAVYLSSTYQTGHKLSGLIYMHRICDFRMTGISRRNFSMFRKLCGDETLKNVVIVTNMWSEVTPEQGAARELELRTDALLFKPVIDKGAEMVRHDGSRRAAEAIIHQLINNSPQALRIQRELVDERKDITQTAAGVELDRELAALREQHKQQLVEIQQEMEEALAAKDLETRKELEEVKDNLQRNIDKIESDRDRLSREYADEKARADAKMQEIEKALEAEKQARAERQGEIDRLMKEMEDNRALSAAQREEMTRKINELQSHQGKGFFSSIGRALDSLFGIH